MTAGTGVINYFKNIYEAITTVAKGMWITLKTFFTTPVTVQYPEENPSAPPEEFFKEYSGPLKPLSERYRGFLTVDLDVCTACEACARACPINCIEIEHVKGERTEVISKIDGKKTPKLRFPVRFDIDIGKCMYCGLCVEPCPTGAIYFTRSFEGASYTTDKLILHFVKEEDANRLREMAKKIEEEAKKKTAQQAVVSGGEKK
jgi:formate hydrogenlyase subunit 6/NADH:ubiquinone oxidoreductase subunit I